MLPHLKGLCTLRSLRRLVLLVLWKRPFLYYLAVELTPRWR
jgi:hypothetical protein